MLITGSGSGIGAATAVAAALAGYRVVASVHSLDRVDDLRSRIASAEAGVLDIEFRELDVTSQQAAAALLADIVARYGALHAVISNAGITRMGTFENEPVESYRRVFDVNFFGPIALLKRAMPHLRASHGRIIAVSSLNGVVSTPFQEAYNASKFALEGALESLAPVARRVGVDVSVVAPGPTSDTHIWQTIDIAGFRAAATSPYTEVIDRYFANAADGLLTDLPAGQLAAEVAQVIVGVLGSDEPAFRYTTSTVGTELLARKLVDPTGDTLVARTGSWLDRQPTPAALADPVPADPVPADPVPADPVPADPVPAGPVPAE
ncbi:hypothetical protein CC117_24070 [Parafrankia colletiae]|uniref:Short-chain alcohol dehydrogenase n=1 Tax=Parafrankia colletiae TaxID=573497 RepID=A0A1S1QHZ2_9ACTN|nr:hypothetical protein CC117_24070 [Parafrankia colletiae]